jgi:hypothetical protein
MGASLAGFLLGGILLIVGWWPIGLPLFVAAIAVLWRGFGQQDAYHAAYDASMPKPADSLIDRILDRELRGVEQRALARLELTAEDLELEAASWDPVAQSAPGESDRLARKPWMVVGPVPTFAAAIGRDGLWRFPQHAVLIICPTDYHLAIYRCVIDLRVAGYHQEETQEYHYSDVVAVVTAIGQSSDVAVAPVDLREETPSSNGDHTFARTLLHEFQLVVSSGDRSRIVVGISDEQHPDQQVKLPESGIEQVIRAVRKMLRDKKAGKGA